MPETPGDASLGELPENQIPALAELYDEFAQTQLLIRFQLRPRAVHAHSFSKVRCNSSSVL
jgi:hypothetical protein